MEENNKPKESTESTEPRLYNRGRDQVNKDDYIRQAELDFNMRVKRLKPKQAAEARKAFATMLQGIDSGDMTYRLGGGYSNHSGITNTSKGFDAPGFAAYSLGETLRGMSLYKKEEDKTKTKWDGNKSVGDYIVNHIFGSDSGNVQDFIDLDPADKNGKRATSNRAKVLLEALDSAYNNFDSIFTSVSSKDAEEWKKNYQTAKTALSDGVISDNEYLALSRATGLSDLRSFFGSGAQETTTSTDSTSKTDSTSSVASTGSSGTETAVNTPVDNTSTTTVKAPSKRYPVTVLNDGSKYGRSTINAFTSFMTKLSNDALFKSLGRAISDPKKYASVFNNAYSKRYYYGVELTPHTVLKGILNETYRRGALSSAKFQTKEGEWYYLTGTQSGNTILCWNKTRQEIHRLDLNTVKRLSNYGKKKVVTNQQGGRILKYAKGGVNVGKTDKYKWSTIFEDTYAPAIKEAFLKIQKDASLNDEQKRAKKQEIVDKVNTLQLDHYNLTQGNWDGNTFNSEAVKKYQTDAAALGKAIGLDRDFINEGISKHLEMFNTARKSTANKDNKDAGWVSDGIYEWYTHTRTPIGRIGDLIDQDTFRDVGVDIISGTQFGQGGNYNFLKLRDEPTFGVVPGAAIDTSKLNGKLDGVRDDEAIVDENAGNNNKPFDLNNINDWLSKLSGTGRLLTSLATNRKNYETVLPSIKAPLENTYYLHHPVYGDFASIQAKNKQAAEILSTTSKMQTSDARLATNAAFAAFAKSKQLQDEGKALFNKKVEDTLEKSIHTSWGNVERATKTANTNYKSLIQAGLDRAKFKATRQKNDWQSWDNYLTNIESTLQKDYNDKRKLQLDLDLQIIQSEADRRYDLALAPLKQELLDWKIDPDNKGVSMTNWPKWDEYKRAEKVAAQEKANYVREQYSKLMGLSYNYSDYEFA